MSDENRFQLVRKGFNPDTHDRAGAKSRLSTRTLPKGQKAFEESARFFQLDAGLETAINMALAVGAPLLLTGEPGTGKTQVAYFLGWYFDIPVFRYQVRSTSQAEDLKYDFDAVAYLREAHHPDPTKRRERADFLKPRALWHAYSCESPSVILIDEIDKAPRDFPNDLLQELDKHEFAHPFADTQMIRPKAAGPPIVVITSNIERQLPDAFLRRCIFHHIELNEELIETVVSARIGDFPRLDQQTLSMARQVFWEIRKRELRKPPSTAELLVWLMILSAQGVTVEKIAGVPLRELPAVAALIKSKEDLELIR